jgi:hypothetical protein
MSGKKEQVKKYANIYPVSEEDVISLWNYWLQIHGSSRGKPHTFTPSRRRALEKALGICGYETAMKAILGCSFSDFHMGGNDSGKKYNSVELIFRDEWRIAKFVDLAEEYSEHEGS